MLVCLFVRVEFVGSFVTLGFGLGGVALTVCCDFYCLWVLIIFGVSRFGWVWLFECGLLCCLF